jgi:hypothetical protein
MKLISGGKTKKQDSVSCHKFYQLSAVISKRLDGPNTPASGFILLNFKTLFEAIELIISLS